MLLCRCGEHLSDAYYLNQCSGRYDEAIHSKKPTSQEMVEKKMKEMELIVQAARYTTCP